MLTALRAEANALLAATCTRRKPALRRSDAPGALLATDLPFAADPDAVADFTARAERAGWLVTQAPNGWLLLDHEVPLPDAPLPDVADGACGRCLSILMRHPEAGDAREWIRRIVTALDAGERDFQRLCERLQAELAAMLRRREPLPGALAPYLAQAYITLEKRRNPQ